MGSNTEGLMNTSATFMQTMTKIFIDMLDKGVVVLLGDILIYSNIVEQQL